MAYPGNTGGERPNEPHYGYQDPNVNDGYPQPPAAPPPAPPYGQADYQASSPPAPSYGQPSYGQPPAQPSHTQPEYQASSPPAQSYGQPEYQASSPPAPSYGQSDYQASSPPGPSYGQPDYGQQEYQAPGGYAVPAQPTPVHDQGQGYPGQTAALPTYNAYSVDPPLSGAPASNSPMSSPPIMGTIVGQPVSGPYGPVQVYDQGQPPKKRGAAVPVLASLLALFVILSLVFVGLYVDKSGKLTKSQKTVANQRTTISDRDSDLEKTKKDLQAKTTQLDQAQQDLRGTKNESDQAKKDKEILATCFRLLTKAGEASRKGDTATMNSLLAQADEPCRQADAIVGLS